MNNKIFIPTPDSIDYEDANSDLGKILVLLIVNKCWCNL